MQTQHTLHCLQYSCPLRSSVALRALRDGQVRLQWTGNPPVANWDLFAWTGDVAALVPPGSRFFPQTIYCGSSILEKKELATLTGRAPQLCGWALWPGSVSGPCPPLCPPLVLQTDPNSLLWQFDLREKRAGHTHWPRPSTLWLGSVARLCVRALSSSLSSSCSPNRSKQFTVAVRS